VGILSSACHRGKSVNIRAILVMSLVALGSSAASAEPLLAPMFSEVAPPRPPRLIGRSTSHQAHSPAPKSRRVAAPANKPEQKSAAASAPANPNMVTIGASAPARAADPTPTGSTPDAPSFPPVQILE